MRSQIVDGCQAKLVLMALPQLHVVFQQHLLVILTMCNVKEYSYLQWILWAYNATQFALSTCVKHTRGAKRSEFNKTKYKEPQPEMYMQPNKMLASREETLDIGNKP